MKHFLRLLALAGAAHAHAQAPARPAPTPEPVACIPSAQAKVLDAAVRRYEKLKPIYVQVVTANGNWRLAHRKDSLARRSDAALLAIREQQLDNSHAQERNAAYKATFWQKKAKRRGLTVFLETLALLIGGYAVVNK